MPPRPRSGLQLRIFGAENAKGHITQYRESTLQKVEEVLAQEAPTAADFMRSTMRGAHPWGTGRAADSITADVGSSLTGPTVKISIANYPEVKYLTKLLPDSDFQPGPYIIPAKNVSRLNFYWKRHRKWISPKFVEHPGFPQGDVLEASGTQALTYLGQAVERAARSVVAEVQAGGRIFSVSKRR